MNFSALFEKTPLITNECIWIATPRPFWKCGLAFCCPFVSTRSQKTSEEFLVLSPSSRILEGVFSWRLSHVSSLVTFLSLLLSGLVLAQVSEHASSMETEFKKEQGWEENIISTTATPYRDDRIRRERFRLKSEAYGLVHDRLRREMPVAGNSAEKPVAHMSMNICDRTAVVMDAIISRISATNDCSEVTSTQLAAITGTLNLSSKNISSLKAGDFDGLISLNTLDLSRNDLTALPAGIFDELISLASLLLWNNDFFTLPDDIFDELTSLTKLELDARHLSTLPADIFDELSSLTGLLCWVNELSALPADIFDELSSLTWLGLRGNDLSTLPGGIFDELTTLTVLDLESNNLIRLPAGIFDELTSLTSLWLRANDLSALPAGIFDELTSLTRLDLGRNDLSTLPAGIFDKLTSLNTLNLGHNGLSTLPAGIFDELTVLDWVDLRANDLSTLSDGIFDELSSLTGLGLSGNDLSTLSNGIFDELTSLTELGLAGNDFSTLSADIFDELISLTSLHLGDNSLSSLPDGIFDELTSLTRLGLWANDFTTLPDGIFDELTSLTELGLSGNDLSTLSADIFDGLNSLTSLYLEDNDLSTLPAGIFDKLTSLTGLWFWNNDLSTLPDGIFDEMTSLTALDLGGNNLSTLPDGLFDKLAKLSLRERFSPYGLSLHANPGAPFSPVVNAGADLTAQPGAAVSISGSVKGPWGNFVRWEWIQVDSPNSDVPIAGALPLTGGDTAMPSFTAPTVEGELYFKLVAAPGHEGTPSEAFGHAYSAPDWVTVTVSNLPTSTSETPSVVEFRLLGNYPNPFNPSTTILLDVPQVAAVTVDVFNVLGQRVHREEFQAVAAGASKPLPLDVYHLSAGAYIYQVTTQMGKEVHSASGRMTLIK